jgi:hypothetical protein
MFWPKQLLISVTSSGSVDGFRSFCRASMDRGWLDSAQEEIMTVVRHNARGSAIKNEAYDVNKSLLDEENGDRATAL